MQRHKSPTPAPTSSKDHKKNKEKVSTIPPGTSDPQLLCILEFLAFPHTHSKTDCISSMRPCTRKSTTSIRIDWHKSAKMSGGRERTRRVSSSSRHSKSFSARRPSTSSHGFDWFDRRIERRDSAICIRIGNPRVEPSTRQALTWSVLSRSILDPYTPLEGRKQRVCRRLQYGNRGHSRPNRCCNVRKLLRRPLMTWSPGSMSASAASRTASTTQFPSQRTSWEVSLRHDSTRSLLATVCTAQSMLRIVHWEKNEERRRHRHLMSLLKAVATNTTSSCTCSVLSSTTTT